MSILIISQGKSGNLKKRLGQRPEFAVIGSTDNVDVGFTLAERHRPTIILLELDLNEDEGFTVAEVFTQEIPGSGLILMTRSNDPQILRHALRVGAKEVVALPIMDDQILGVIGRVVQQEKRRREFLIANKKQRPQFKTVTVFSTKGGVGKTTIALNLAIAMRQLTKKRVVLVDLNLVSGNAALMAGVPWRLSIKDMVDEISNLDKETIDSYCTSHGSGLKILPAPISPEVAGFIQADHIEKILSLTSQVYNYVIIDAPNFLHDTLIPALEQSQEIIIITTLDLASIQCLKQCLILLTGISMRPKIRLVVNRLGYSGGLNVKDLENELGLPIYCVIPDSGKSAVDAVNLGKPIILSDSKSPAARVIHELAAKIITDDDNHLFNNENSEMIAGR